MENVKDNQKFPRLTKEELEFFKIRDRGFFKKYNLNWRGKWPLQRRIAQSLQTLAVKEILGFYGSRNKKEAVEHHLKACKYDPRIACRYPHFRRMAGLLVYTRCEMNL